MWWDNCTGSLQYPAGLCSDFEGVPPLNAYSKMICRFLWKCSREEKLSITKEGGSENTFSVKFWKVNETTKYGKVVPDGKNILEEFHLITFVQDVLIWMTYINCILKLTALPTAAHGNLPGAGRVSVLSVQVQAQPGWGWEPFCCFLEEKSMVALDTARKCPLRAASEPPGSSVLGPLSCTNIIPMQQRGGMDGHSNALGRIWWAESKKES